MKSANDLACHGSALPPSDKKTTADWAVASSTTLNYIMDNTVNDFTASRASTTNGDGGTLLPVGLTPITYTVFRNKYGLTLKTETRSWKELCEMIRDVPTYPAKEQCPLIKLASFGTVRKKKKDSEKEGSL